MTYVVLQVHYCLILFTVARLFIIGQLRKLENKNNAPGPKNKRMQINRFKRVTGQLARGVKTLFYK